MLRHHLTVYQTVTEGGGAFVVLWEIVYFALLQQPLSKIADRIPDGEKADHEDGNKDKHDILRMDTDRIGIDDERTARRS